MNVVMNWKMLAMTEFYSDEFGTLYNGDCKSILESLEDNSIDCIVTSPPYWGLRNYGVEGQLGNEPYFRDYISRLADYMCEAGRLLKDTGTMWINLGDTYYSKNKGAGGHSKKQDSNKGSWYKMKLAGDELPEKSLCQIPSRFAIEMQDRGWILRNDIIWAKPNPMPESVTDRLTKSHEHIFLFTKSKDYHFDNLAIAEECVTKEKRPFGAVREREFGYNSKHLKARRMLNKSIDGIRGNVTKEGENGLSPQRHGQRISTNVINNVPIRNKRDVWFISPKPYKGAHFATFPKDLIEPCILAGCPENGIVLDTFFGSGTTGIVAESLNRKWMGIELNQEYCKLSVDRILEERNK